METLTKIVKASELREEDFVCGVHKGKSPMGLAFEVARIDAGKRNTIVYTTRGFRFPVDSETEFVVDITDYDAINDALNATIEQYDEALRNLAD